MIEVLRFSEENLLSQSTEKLCRGILLRFTNFLVSKKFLDKGGGGGRTGEGRGYNDFLSKFFLSQFRKVS